MPCSPLRTWRARSACPGEPRLGSLQLALLAVRRARRRRRTRARIERCQRPARRPTLRPPAGLAARWSKPVRAGLASSDLAALSTSHAGGCLRLTRRAVASAALVLDRLDRGGGRVRVEVLAHRSSSAGGRRRVRRAAGCRSGCSGRRSSSSRHAVEVLHQRAQRVAVRGDQHGLPAAAGRARSRRTSTGSIRSTTSLRHSVRGTSSVGQRRVARVVDLAELVVVGDRRRRHVVGAAPEHELLLAVLLERLLLVLALQRAVVPLVEPPRAPDRDPVPVDGVEARAAAVRIARRSTEVCSTSGSRPALGRAARRRARPRPRPCRSGRRRPSR